jgi:hypothetical protein
LIEELYGQSPTEEKIKNICILCAKNDHASGLNEKIQRNIRKGETTEYISIDSIALCDDK